MRAARTVLLLNKIINGKLMRNAHACVVGWIGDGLFFDGVAIVLIFIKDSTFIEVVWCVCVGHLM